MKRVAPYLGPLIPNINTLQRPKRALIVDIPLRMDDGSIRHFEGFRVHHNLSRGPGKGGIRVDPNKMSEGELERLTRKYTSEIASLIGPQQIEATT